MTSVPTFATRPTFLGLERSNADATICVAGIPFDLGTSNRPGARFGPAAIRQASRMLVDGDHPASWAEIEALDLADIGEVERFDLGPGCRMVAIDQHAARLADCRWPKARPGPVRGAQIKRDSGDANRRIGVGAFDAEKRWPCGECRDRGHSPVSGAARTG